MYWDVKFAQIIKATYHKSQKNENSYSYDISAATEVSLSVFFIKTWQTSSPFLSESCVQIEKISRVDVTKKFSLLLFLSKHGDSQSFQTFVESCYRV